MWTKKARPPCCWPRGQQVSHQRWLWGIHCIQSTNHASQESALVLKPKADATRSPKQEYQWSHKMDLCPPIFFFKNLIYQKCITCAPPTGTGIVMYCCVPPPVKDNKQTIGTGTSGIPEAYLTANYLSYTSLKNKNSLRETANFHDQ